MIPSNYVPPERQPTLFGHPIGLAFLFGTEMWERFAYYGMRAFLMYYMIKGLGMAQANASDLYGWYIALVYLTPAIGGYLADQVFGQHKMVVAGGLLMALGQFLLGLSESLFYPGLLLLVIGNGGFKANISTQVGNLYPENDPRRDGAFSIFYIGINLGGFLGPLVAGVLGEVVGWRWGFWSASIGLLLGLGIYQWGRRYLPADNLTRRRAENKAAARLTRNDWEAVGALVVICLFVVFFWATYEQQGNTIALWADTNTDRVLALGSWSWEVPASVFQAVNSFYIFFMTPLLIGLWQAQRRKGKEPTTVTKMALGCIFMGLSWLIMIGAARDYAAHGPTNMLWLIAFLGVLTVGELYLSPVGLSLFSKVSPPQIVSLMFGVWFLATFVGNYGSGLLGGYWEIWDKETFFFIMFLISFSAGLGIFLFNRPLKRIIQSRMASNQGENISGN